MTGKRDDTVTMIEALAIISGLADTTIETDPKLRSNAARQFRRIAELADRTLRNQPPPPKWVAASPALLHEQMRALESEFGEVLVRIIEHPDTKLDPHHRYALMCCQAMNPSSRGKDITERIREAIWAVAGRPVHRGHRVQLERLYVQALKWGEG